MKQVPVTDISSEDGSNSLIIPASLDGRLSYICCLRDPGPWPTLSIPQPRQTVQVRMYQAGESVGSACLWGHGRLPARGILLLPIRPPSIAQVISGLAEKNSLNQPRRLSFPVMTVFCSRCGCPEALIFLNSRTAVGWLVGPFQGSPPASPAGIKPSAPGEPGLVLASVSQDTCLAVGLEAGCALCGLPLRRASSG